MEYLDIYDKDKNHLGIEARDIVHQKGLWHNTIHCWLYDNDGNIFFQIRKGENKFYTTASGHVLAGETIKEGFGREIKEEIGIYVDYDSASLVDVFIWKMDSVKKDGSIFCDRAFSNVYVCLFDLDNSDLLFDENEVSGLVKVNAKDTLKLFKNEINSIPAVIIKDNNKEENINVSINDFLVTENETVLSKYGIILDKVIKLTEKKDSTV